MSSIFSLETLDLIAGILATASVVMTAHTIIKTEESRKLFMKIMTSKKPKEVIDSYKKIPFPGRQPSIIFKAIYTINFSLAKSIILVLEDQTEANNGSRKANTIVGLLLMEKMKKSSSVLLALMLAVLVDLGLQQFTNYGSYGYVTLISAALWSAILLDHKIIELRIRKGWYGKNEFEAREIINFALTHANKDDFNDQGGLKKIVPLPEIPEAETSPVSAWGTHA